MNLPTVQAQVARFVAEHDLETSVEVRLLDLVSEVGELVKEPLKATNYGRSAFLPTEAWADEIGDVLFALTCLANSTGVDMDAALLAAVAKYERRLGERGTAGSSKSL